MASLIDQLDRAALLIVDMEEDFVHGPMAVPGADDLARRLVPLVRAARRAGLLVVFITQALRPGGADLGRLGRFDEIRRGEVLREGSSGVAIVSTLEPDAGDAFVVKRRFSAFLGTDLDLLLRSRGIDQVIICGVSAHICCDTTTRDAFQLGYDPFYVVDGVAMGDLADAGFGPIPAAEGQRVIATVLAGRFATLCTINDLLARLAE